MRLMGTAPRTVRASLPLLLPRIQIAHPRVQSTPGAVLVGIATTRVTATIARTASTSIMMPWTGRVPIGVLLGATAAPPQPQQGGLPIAPHPTNASLAPPTHSAWEMSTVIRMANVTPATIV